MSTRRRITPCSNWLRIPASLVLLATMLGCASTGAVRPTQAIAGKLSKFKKVAVSASSRVPGATQEIVQLENMIVARLRDRGVFKKVFSSSSAPDTSGDLRLDVKIVELRTVGSGARVILGALAGRASIRVDVELLDKNGKRLGAFQAEGKSSGGTAFSGTTPEAIERAVEEITAYIGDNM